MGKVIAIDFDGTCVSNKYPEVGADIGAVPVLKALTQNGHRLILFTMRDNKDIISPDSGLLVNPLRAAVNWFDYNGIPLWGVNKNPSQWTWTKSPKPYAHFYIDDCGIGIPKLYDEEGKPFVDWESVAEILLEEGLISEQQYNEL